jgi:glycosyltransferase involved in cell wall biosynthesis
MKACFLGGARYSQPLDATSERKFRVLEQLGEIFVIGFSQNLKPRRFSDHAHFYLLPKFPLPLLRYLAMFAVGPVLALWLIWRHGVRILVAQSPYEGFAAAIVKVVAGWFGRRLALIVENHGDFEESLFLQRRVRWVGLYCFLMHYSAGFALKHADLLRAVSDSTRAQLERRAPVKPIAQFVAWTDIEVFFKAGINSRKTINTIVYAGVLIPRKGVEFLIDAFAQVAHEFSNARLWLIGKAENKEYAKALKTQVARFGLNGNVEFFEALPQQELAKYMARACALVLPSLSEGLGRVVFEGMACGTPVIGSSVGGIPGMIEEGVTGFLVPPGDLKELTERLLWVLRHPKEAEKMGQKAREFAQRFFSPQAYQQSYDQLFRKAENILQ